MGDRALQIRFEIPRAELDRAEAEARAKGAAAFRAGAGFDAGQLRGRVHFDVGAPFLADPVLSFLEKQRGLRLDPPLTVSLDQPVGYVLAQVASASVMALCGEGAFSVPLPRGRAAIGAAVEAEAFELSLPLEQYGGTVAIPQTDAARAVASACDAFANIMADRPALAPWPLAASVVRDGKILHALSAGGRGTAGPPQGFEGAWALDAFARGEGPSLPQLASAAEAQGAHVVPYWRADLSGNGGRIAFAPLRSPRIASWRGCLARCIFPGADERLEVAVRDPGATARLRERLRRPLPFTAVFEAPSADPTIDETRVAAAPR